MSATAELAAYRRLAAKARDWRYSDEWIGGVFRTLIAATAEDECCTRTNPAEMVSEIILRLASGESAPPGYELKRILGTFERMTGPGTNTETVYVVAAVLRPPTPEGGAADG